MSSKAVDIFSFTDYREYLRVYYEARHSLDRSFSHRHVSLELGDKSPSFFLKVIREGRKLKDHQLELLTHILELDEAESSYLTLLYRYGTAPDKAQKEYWLNQIVSRCRHPKREMGAQAARYYAQWHHSAIRCLLSVMDIADDPQPLVKQLRPRISLNQAKASMALLEELQLIARDEKGFWKPVDNYVFAKSSIHDGVLQSHRLQSVELVRENILLPDPAWPPQLFTATLSVSDAAWRDIQERFQQFRAEVRNIVRNDEAPQSRVVHLLHASLPLSEPIEHEEKN